MLRTFIFDESKSQWIEEEQKILPQDVCVILDETQEILYLWNGQKSSKAKFRKGYKQINDLVANFPELNLQIIMASKNFPSEVKTKIDEMGDILKFDKERNLKFSRFTTIRIFSISIVLAVLLPIILLLYISTCLSWSIVGGNYQISSIMYNSWIYFSKTLTIVILIIFSINILIGVIENEHQAIIFSVIGLIVSIGLILYLNQGIFLFLFQAGSTLITYFISQKDIIVFLLLILIAIMIFEIPNIYKLISFFKTYGKFIF
jgi:hypothetical protein